MKNSICKFNDVVNKARAFQIDNAKKINELKKMNF